MAPPCRCCFLPQTRRRPMRRCPRRRPATIHAATRAGQQAAAGSRGGRAGRVGHARRVGPERSTPPGTIRVVSEGGTSGKIIVADGVSVKLERLAGAFTSGDLRIGAVRCRLRRCSRAPMPQARWRWARAPPCRSAVRARWTHPAPPAAVRSPSVKPPTSAFPAARRCPAAPLSRPTVIAVTNDENAPMARTQIVLKLGNEEPFNVTTGSKRNRDPLARTGAERHGRGGAQRSGYLRRRHQWRRCQP